MKYHLTIVNYYIRMNVDQERHLNQNQEIEMTKVTIEVTASDNEKWMVEKVFNSQEDVAKFFRFTMEAEAHGMSFRVVSVE